MSKSIFQEVKLELDTAKPVERSDLRLGVLALTGENYKATRVTFTRCEFHGRLRLEDININLGIRFQDCTFKDSVKLLELSANQNVTTPHEELAELVFENCIFELGLEISGTQVPATITLLGCEFRQDVLITDLNTGSGTLTLESCTFNGKLTFNDVQTTGDLNLCTTTLKQEFLIQGFSCRKLSLEKLSVLNGDFRVHKGTTNEIAFHKGDYFGTVEFSSISTDSAGFSFTESTFKKAFLIQNSSGTDEKQPKLNRIDVRSGNFAGGLYISGDLQAGNWFGKIDEISIQASAMLTGHIAISALLVHRLILRGYNADATFSFRTLAIHHLSFSEFINTKEMVFSDLKASDRTKNGGPSLLEIIDSNLGKAQFYQTDFTTFETVRLRNVILTEISSFDVRWFTEQQLQVSEADELLTRIKQRHKNGIKDLRVESRKRLLSALNSRRELYRQLKFVCQKQGDMPQALKFQSSEMRHYNEILTYEKPRNNSEYLIMLLSRTNDFGQNWIKAFRHLLLWSFIFYIPIGFLGSSALNYGKFADSYDDIGLNLKVIFLDNLKFWLVSLNPTHRIKDFSENIDSYPRAIYFFDLISRVVVSIFIFQVVTAFRKFNR